MSTVFYHLAVMDSARNTEDLSDLNQSEFEWIQLRKEIGSETLKHQEDAKAKLIRKFKENPFVPIGCLATAAALTYGLYSFRHGRQKMSQNMMRLRIGAQGFTVAALLFGMGFSNIGSIK